MVVGGSPGVELGLADHSILTSILEAGGRVCDGRSEGHGGRRVYSGPGPTVATPL